ncbi:GNAT family N-acetyltransferase [Adlercreutzia mucosicola]|uniref:GNAT family N-acetyltransferase n=1 Tax=Adlercreutzia mucosicola TaxID=580026 RepID=UPI0003FCBF3B|nr:GNAT family N-acetyltransferase [Adlercreutzia mucosicola]MCR2035017.1 GNAT family N-acetyltransferase [Adlercreutzia mucosicola]
MGHLPAATTEAADHGRNVSMAPREATLEDAGAEPDTEPAEAARGDAMLRAATPDGVVILRAATPDDAAAIAALAAEASVGALSDRGRSFVAERHGTVAGFIRLVEAEGCWYVNPVVVAAEHHRTGLGALLMHFAHERFGELRFVARGYAVPFYEALGCEKIGWDAIAPIIAADCDGCEAVPTCRATPMRMS